jgi:hypothetical protein
MFRCNVFGGKRTLAGQLNVMLLDKSELWLIIFHKVTLLTLQMFV